MSIRGKKRVLGGRPEEPEERGSENDSAQELSDDRGLADPLHELPEKAPDEDEGCDLRE
jgi:hypothetical protein